MAGTHRGSRYSQASSKAALSRRCSLRSQSCQCQLMLGSWLHSKAFMASAFQTASNHRWSLAEADSRSTQWAHTWKGIHSFLLLRRSPTCQLSLPIAAISTDRYRKPLGLGHTQHNPPWRKLLRHGKRYRCKTLPVGKGPRYRVECNLQPDCQEMLSRTLCGNGTTGKASGRVEWAG